MAEKKIKVPRAQLKGPIVAGPTSYVICPHCSRLFGMNYGLRRRDAARHLADHRSGLIRRPEVPA